MSANAWLLVGVALSIPLGIFVGTWVARGDGWRR